MLTGPVTILNWSFPREDISIRIQLFNRPCYQGMKYLTFEAAGVKIIQIDEAALRENCHSAGSGWYEDYLDWAIPAFRWYTLQ